MTKREEVGWEHGKGKKGTLHNEGTVYPYYKIDKALRDLPCSVFSLVVRIDTHSHTHTHTHTLYIPGTQTCTCFCK